MGLKKIEQVKKDRGFKLFDIIIYGTVILIVVVLFIVLFTTRDTGTMTGVKISLRAKIIFEYEFGGTYDFDENFVTIEDDKDGITVVIVDGNDRNVAYIDKTENSVKMIEANCKGKECMYFEAMKDNSDFIYCSPHGVKIEPLNKDLDDPVIPFG